MLKEVRSGVRFVTDLLSRKGLVPQQKVDKFSSVLESLLCTKYNNHWFPSKPMQGSGYRCIRITQSIMDPEIEKAATVSGVTAFDLTNTLPKEFTMWIDPEDVSYRIGEDGSICTLENDQKLSLDPSPASTTIIQSCQSEVNKSDFVDANNSSFTQCWS